MNLNPLFSKASRRDFKRDMPWLIMYFLIFLFLIPVGYLFGLQGVRENIRSLGSAGPVNAQEMLFNHALRFLGMGVSTAVLAVAGLLEAYHEFGYLHRSKEIDFYHSLPTTRKGLFFGRLLNGMRFVMIPYLTAVAIGLVCALITGAGMKGIMQAVLSAVLLNTLTFLQMYLIGILAVMLTGRALTGILGMFVLIGYCPMLGLLIDDIPSLWYASYAGGNTTQGAVRILQELSPLTQAVLYGSTYEARFYMPQTYEAVTGGFLLRTLIGSSAVCVLVLLCMKLYEKRPLEKAGDAMIFAPTEPVIRILITALGGLGVMSFMRALGRSLGWIIFFTISAVILVHVIVELIYRADAKKVFSHKAELIAMAVLSVAAVLLIAFDVFGFESYLPDPGKVESAGISFTGYPSNMFYEEDPQGGSYAIYSDTDLMNPQETITGEAEIAAIRAIAQEGIAWGAAHDSSPEGLFDTAIDEDAFDATEQVMVTWILRNGDVKKRLYRVDRESIRDSYGTLLDSEAYKKMRYPVLAEGEDHFIAAAYEENDKVFRVEDPARQKQLTDAYLMDLRDMTMEEIDGKVPCGLIQLHMSEEYAAQKDEETNGRFASGRWNGPQYDAVYLTRLYLRYPVYDSFKRTAEVLASEGITMGEAVPLTGVSPLTYDFYETGEDGIEREYTGTIDDTEEQKTIFKHLVIYPYSDYNMYGPRTFAVDFQFELDGEDHSAALAVTPETEPIIERIYAENGLSTD